MKHSAYLAALSTVFLVACGGGSSDPAPATPSTIAAAAPSVGDCFELTPGIKFIKSNGYKELNVQETFEGSTAFGAVELRSDDTRFGASYQTISGGFVHGLGLNQYDQTGVLDGKNVYSSGFQIPVDMAVGQTAQLTYTDTFSDFTIGTTSTSNVSVSLTLAGFEDLTLAGRAFVNTCKFTMPSSAGQTDVLWFAKGFGIIRKELEDAQGVMVAGSRIELATIVSAP
ncbi:MAG TPA: hypothetical protein DEQ40_20955 [Oxalobacteraceae bacterium]|nr:hypothetical protein [Oxalobacteraceae bacterium]